MTAVYRPGHGLHLSKLGAHCHAADRARSMLREAMGWMGSHFGRAVTRCLGWLSATGRRRGYGVAVFPARPAQSSGGSGQLGAVTVG